MKAIILAGGKGTRLAEFTKLIPKPMVKIRKKPIIIARTFSSLNLVLLLLSKRIFVVDGSMLEDEEMKDFKEVFINPTIESETGEAWEFEEGCLSIPGVRGSVSRKSKIQITYFDEEWNKKTKEYDGMRARVIQHEFDHINGKLFVDYLPSLKRKLLKNKLSEILRGKVDVNYNVKK